MPPPDDDHMHQNDVGGFFPPPSRARKVRGGIRPQGPLGRSWWARRWLAALEAIGLGDRLERGRAYARDGQVLTLEIGMGSVAASVQGTRVAPYETRIELAVIGQLHWLEVAQALARQARFRSQLLGGEMPDDIEAVFSRLDLRLFPTLEEDLTTSCTCADWANPCRHVAAACYLVGEAFDRDPFLLFRLRGIEREVLLAMLQGTTPVGAGDADGGDGPGDPEEHGSTQLEATEIAARFWHGEESPTGAPVLDIEPPTVDAPLARLLGPLPMWTGADDFEPALRRIHACVATDPRLLDLAVGSNRSLRR